MPRKNDMCNSILIVSSSEQFVMAVKRSLTGFITIDVKKSASLARRSILERYYDLIAVNAPLPDETGEDFAIDAAEKSSASVLLVVPQEVFEDALTRVTDYGILVVPKPAPRGRIDAAIRYLTAVQNRMHDLEKKNTALEEKIEELRTVSKAKLLLVEKKHMTEDEAHKYIGKQAMDNGISRGRAAKMLLDELE
ncbi:MAG: ANTAR domain-containing protein [Lachnospiraceae bacterium]|nr:ANTAR domain-containing protein [Lachnospiraceae bacterium]